MPLGNNVEFHPLPRSIQSYSSDQQDEQYNVRESSREVYNLQHNARKSQLLLTWVMSDIGRGGSKI